MRKHVFVLVLLLLGLPLLARADAPVYFAPSSGQAPYETVQTLDVSPFSQEAVLLEVDVLGIRQGDCIIITCGGERLLIDGGEGWRFPYVDGYLKTKGITHFDYFLLTHAHDDHIEMQEKLLKAGYTVDKVLSPYDEKDTYSLWTAYKKQLNAAKIPFEKVQTGDVLTLGGATLTFYRWDNSKQTMNNHSVAAMLRFGDAAMFLAADIGGETQHWLLENFDNAQFKCDVYKTAHHNRTATVPEFLTAMSPALAINTNTRSSTMTGDKQQDGRDIARYYISMGTVHLQTDGTQWYAWQTPMDEEK